MPRGERQLGFGVTLDDIVEPVDALAAVVKLN
jgi:hypothetical protein